MPGHTETILSEDRTELVEENWTLAEALKCDSLEIYENTIEARKGTLLWPLNESDTDALRKTKLQYNEDVEANIEEISFMLVVDKTLNFLDEENQVFFPEGEEGAAKIYAFFPETRARWVAEGLSQSDLAKTRAVAPGQKARSILGHFHQWHLGQDGGGARMQ